eukprot:COSAG01_NODE_16789_length_1204_cov_1.721267_2_plen_127_part_00
MSPPLATVGSQAGGRRMLQPGMGSGTDFRGVDDAWCLGASSPTEHVHKQALGKPLHGVPWEGRSEVQSSPRDWQNVSLPWSAVHSPPPLEQLEPVPSRREYMRIHNQSFTPPNSDLSFHTNRATSF